MPPLTIIPRSEWGALPPLREIQDLPNPVFKVLMTKTRTLPCNSDEECALHLRKLQAFHMGKGMEDIAYNFIITPDSKVYEGRGWYKVAPTPKERPEFENKALVIGHIGDFPESDDKYRWQIRTTMGIIENGILNTKSVDYEATIDSHPSQINMYLKALNIADYAVNSKLWSEEVDFRLINNWMDFEDFELHVSRLDDNFTEPAVEY